MDLSASKEPNDHEQAQWEHLVENTFERPVQKTPVVREKKRFPIPKKWLWAALAAVAVILAAIFILPTVLEKSEASMPAQLHICKQALDEWQALDSYKITGTFYRYGYSSKGATQWNEQYWVSGEDWVMFNSAYKQVISSSQIPPAGYMYRDGDFYITFTDTSPIWTPEPETERETNDLDLWPMTFSWDAFELIYLGTTQTDYSTAVLFAAIDRSNEEFTSVYDVEFQMTLGGKLNSITVIQTRPDGIITKDVYLLSSSDADDVADYIASQQVVEFTDADIVSPDGKSN